MAPRLDPASISFRLLEESDLVHMHRWLNTPHVLEWWDKPGPTYEEVVAKYSPRILAQEPARCFVILHGGIPIGFIQTYRIGDYPEYSRHLPIDENAAGIDLFIGEEAFVHRGLGSRIIRRFLLDVVFASPEVTTCVIGPAVSNRSASEPTKRPGSATWPPQRYRMSGSRNT